MKDTVISKGRTTDKQERYENYYSLFFVYGG